MLAVQVYGADEKSTATSRPLIEWPLATGEGASLPWGNPDVWNAVAPDCPVEQIAEKTLGLLGPETPLLVRMETLRRATVYSQRDPSVAYRLLADLSLRVSVAESSGTPNVLAWVDLGYLVETLKQAEWLKQEYFEDLNGYALIRQAILTGNTSPELEFAAAMVVLEPQGYTPHLRHLRTAVSQAREGTLLEKNLLKHFGNYLGIKSSTLTELRKNRYLDPAR